MFKKPKDPVGPLRSGMRIQHWYPVLLILPLLFAVTLSTPAQKVRRAKKPVIAVNIFGLPGILCANEKHPFTVVVSSTTSVTPTGSKKPPKGKREGKAEYPAGLAVNASVSPADIATIDPARAVTSRHWIGDDELGLPSLFPEAVFSLDAKKAGSGTLSVNVEVPGKITHTKNEVHGRTTTFRVVDCTYRMTVEYNFKVSSSSAIGYYSSGQGRMENGKLRVDPETHRITGGGDLISSLGGGETFPDHSCVHKDLSTKNKAEALGLFENGLLKFELFFNKSSFTITKQCKGTTHAPGTQPGNYVQTEKGTLFGSEVMNTLQGIALDGRGDKTTIPLNRPEYQLTGEFIITITPDKTSQ